MIRIQISFDDQVAGLQATIEDWIKYGSLFEYKGKSYKLTITESSHLHTQIPDQPKFSDQVEGNEIPDQ